MTCWVSALFYWAARAAFSTIICYRGEHAPPIKFRCAFVQSGDIVIELIQLFSATPSAFRDMFRDGAEGLHHAAIFCDDYERERDAFVAAGYPVARRVYGELWRTYLFC